MARQARRGGAWYVKFGIVTVWQARFGKVCPGELRSVKASQGRQGKVRWCVFGCALFRCVRVS